jgi:multicomponent Na+:H+ antiporter subunit B
MDSIILRTVARGIIPFVQIYGIYVVFHGHLSPGGGFAGGTIIAASFILYALSYGLKSSKDVFPYSLTSKIEGITMLWYVLIGLLALFLGCNFLTNKEAGVPLGRPGALISGGLILLLNIALGFKVCSTMFILFSSFAEEVRNGDS